MQKKAIIKTIISLLAIISLLLIVTGTASALYSGNDPMVMAALDEAATADENQEPVPEEDAAPYAEEEQEPLQEEAEPLYIEEERLQDDLPDSDESTPSEDLSEEELRLYLERLEKEAN